MKTREIVATTWPARILWAMQEVKQAGVKAEQRTLLYLVASVKRLTSLLLPFFSKDVGWPDMLDWLLQNEPIGGAFQKDA